MRIYIYITVFTHFIPCPPWVSGAFDKNVKTTGFVGKSTLAGLRGCQDAHGGTIARSAEMSKTSWKRWRTAERTVVDFVD